MSVGSINQTFTYNLSGQRTTAYDVCNGTTTYTYDQGGNLISETDAEGRIIEYQYDEYNRLTRIETPEMTSLYDYNEYGHHILQSRENLYI